jgi:putative CocE/NonD family hydrolase
MITPSMRSCRCSRPSSLLPLLVALPLIWPATHLRAQQAGARPAVLDRYEKREVMIPVRDGVRLHTILFVPRERGAPLPFLLERTPYGIDGAAGAFRSYLKELAEDGYIFAFQDIRGRFGSEGHFVMQRPPCAAAQKDCIDEGTDSYDTIDWLLHHVPGNNGRVGMLGVSYPGWLTVMALIHPHPALRAASPQASPADMFIGDDFHHGGAFRLSYGFEYAAMMETGKVTTQFRFPTHDTYDWYLRLGALSHVNERYLHGTIPTWNDFVDHPDYDAFWQRNAVARYMTRVAVPTLSVAGWWDQEDFYGPLTIYKALETQDARSLNYLVVGPWRHGGWAGEAGDSLGAIRFGSPTGEHFRREIQAPWFAYWLKDRGSRPAEAEAVTFETGSNRWRSWAHWPPREGVTDRDLYLRAGRAASFEAPADSGAPPFDEYVSDPAYPVPYRRRPIEPTYDPTGSGWYTWLVQDQRFVEDRPDVLSWSTPPLDHDVTVAGDVVAHLFASTSGGGSDWVVKLIDVYPDTVPARPAMGGYELMVAKNILRARFRNGYEHPERVVPGEVTPYTIDLLDTDHTFLRGHRIMVQVQSTWFPVIDRNPQTWVPNIFEARDEDFRKATQHVYRSGDYPSRITLPVVEARGGRDPD